VNIKRFVSSDMREALSAIRANLGPDAVMLSSRRVGEGVEVIAAIDYDGSLITAVGQEGGSMSASEQPAYRPFPAAVPQEQAAQPRDMPAATEYERVVAALAHNDPAAPAEASREVAAEPPSEAAEPSSQVADELKDLRRLLETQLASLAWNDLNRRRPVQARVLRQFAKLGVDPEIAGHFAALASREHRDAWRIPLRAFAEKLPLANKELVDIGGAYAVVGPTGVGKTTAIAKMAARFILRHGANQLGLVSTDSYRIGAREQLLTFARILGAPMQVADNARELGQVLDGLKSKKLVLIDTAGMSQRDVRLANQFATLRVRGHCVNALLAISAAADRDGLTETLKVFRSVNPRALIVTKIDEATTLGPVLSLAIRGRLPIAYLSDGQRVPEDLHLPGRRRAWLMQAALTLAHDHALRRDEQDLAEEFADMRLAANA